MPSEISARADFTAIRYAQCWEDADILLDALNIQPGDTCVSIASAGDNTLALLSRKPARVIAVDLSESQLACVALRVAAYRTLRHEELLELIGSVPSTRRAELYSKCRGPLKSDGRAFWDARPDLIANGIGTGGKFEHYFALFRTRVLPLVHSRADVESLLAGGTLDQRRTFYSERWDTWRWRLLFRVFFSRFAMGRLGRDPEFFKYVEGSVSDRLLSRTRYALTELNPSDNPYIDWILTGRHTRALPFALRPENFDTIRENLDRLEWRRQPLEDCVAELGPNSVNRFNLSDIFEYMSPPSYRVLLETIVKSARKGGRLAYWNMLAPRSRPPEMAQSLKPLETIAAELFRKDKAFFYSAFVVEEVL